MLATAAFMAMLGSGSGRGSGSWVVSLGFRLSGTGTPAFAHMAAALALAISRSCPLSDWTTTERQASEPVQQPREAPLDPVGGVCSPSSVMRDGLSPQVLGAGERFLRRMSTGEWLGSRFQRSRWLKLPP